ncbi:MAG TPA: pyridoxamine 5'-phosphate oxidase [Fimbriimonadaceae bacterium]|nr:pyridoxamine 5'-phosphate oxidase [Fimbriimonadaceae bacterium]
MSDAFLGLRSEYASRILAPELLDADPYRQLSIWLEEALDASIVEPHAMALATADAEGQPSVRMVLLRGIADDGLRFYTNYASRKGQDLAANPRASICLWWGLLERQVRVEGTVHRLDPAESDAYFALRPLASRAASVASPQSREIGSFDDLVESMERLIEGGDVPRPPHWGGYRLVPHSFEFWQGRPARLHDRFLYRPTEEGGWEVVRLAP